MKQLLLLLCIIAPMGLMAQNENLAQDTTLYLNGRKIVIKEQNDHNKQYAAFEALRVCPTNDN